MTIVEVWEELQTIRNTLIQSHVKLNESMDQIEKLLEKISDQVDKDNVPN